MAWDWKPGMRCVCVDDDGPCGYLEAGKVYTVRKICLVPGVDILGRLSYGGIFLNEVYLDDIRYPAGFAIERFRPLSESRLDQFRVHLAPSPRQKERA